MADYDFGLRPQLRLYEPPPPRSLAREVEGEISTVEELRDLIERRWRWRPNTRLSLVVDELTEFGRRDPFLHLVVQMKVQDTYDPEAGFILVTHYRPLFVNLPAPEEGVVRQIRHELHAVDMHESDEWIRVDGEMLFDPHAKDVR